MRMTTRRLFGATTLLALTTSGLLGGAVSASAATLDPGDPRAVTIDGNVDVGQQGNACEVAGLPGEELAAMPAGTFSVEGFNIDITANPEGYTLTGVVVKGGPAYNVYAVDAPDGVTPLGDLPWLDLHPPVNASGNPAGISHWFVCVEKTAATPDEPGDTPGDNPGDTPGDKPGEKPGDTPGVENPDEVTPDETGAVVPTTTVSAGVPTTTTTPAPAVAAGGNDDGLANTGFDGGWMLIVGLGLVAAGAAFVVSPKLRGKLRR